MAKAKTTPETKTKNWYVITNETTSEKSIADKKSFDYAQKNEPLAFQWQIKSKHASEKEAEAAL